MCESDLLPHQPPFTLDARSGLLTGLPGSAIAPPVCSQRSRRPVLRKPVAYLHSSAQTLPGSRFPQGKRCRLCGPPPLRPVALGPNRLLPRGLCASSVPSLPCVASWPAPYLPAGACSNVISSYPVPRSSVPSLLVCVLLSSSSAFPGHLLLFNVQYVSLVPCLVFLPNTHS